MITARERYAAAYEDDLGLLGENIMLQRAVRGLISPGESTRSLHTRDAKYYLDSPDGIRFVRSQANPAHLECVDAEVADKVVGRIVLDDGSVGPDIAKIAVDRMLLQHWTPELSRLAGVPVPQAPIDISPRAWMWEQEPHEDKIRLVDNGRSKWEVPVSEDRSKGRYVAATFEQREALMCALQKVLGISGLPDTIVTPKLEIRETPGGFIGPLLPLPAGSRSVIHTAIDEYVEPEVVSGLAVTRTDKVVDLVERCVLSAEHTELPSTIIARIVRAGPHAPQVSVYSVR
ncbi:MAG: hypothetical protein AAF413_03915 [Patescibacteria group bacterium]